VSRLFEAIMLSALNVPPWRSESKLIDWCCSSMDTIRNASYTGDEACGVDLPHCLNRPVNLAHAFAAEAFGRFSEPSAAFCTSSGKSLIS
jgi:hypothetical protein